MNPLAPHFGPWPAWLVMWALAGGIFVLLKLATLRGCSALATPTGVIGYLFAWPGMNAPTFLRSPVRGAGPRVLEMGFALAKLAVGLVLVAWAAARVGEWPDLLVAWVGMVGIVFTFHFGLFHVVSWCWRGAGRIAPPLMRAPILSRSLAEFWGERWNTAFADLGRRFVLRPLARKWGVVWAGASVFLLSGLVHDLVLSLPARGGWGGPTLYFLLQAAGAWAEKTAPGKRLGLGTGWRGRGWTLTVTAAPLPLLFHAPFAERVIAPMFRFLQEIL